MNRQERLLEKIETALTPKQAVILWLKESRGRGLASDMERVFSQPIAEAPRTRIPLMLAEALRKSVRKRGVSEERIAHLIREAQKEADFLLVLARKLEEAVEFERLQHPAYFLLLREKFKRLLEQ